MYDLGPDGVLRGEAPFPDGSAVVLVYGGSTVFARRAWQDPAPIECGYGSAFRDVAWRYPTAEGTSQFSAGGPPVQPFGNLLTGFTTTRIIEPSGQETDLVASLSDNPSVSESQASWRDLPVTVFARGGESFDDLGRLTVSSFEQWVDVDGGQLERQLSDEDWEGLWSATSELSVTGRSTVPLDPALFDPEGMQIVMDTTGGAVEDAGPVAVTTSIPPLNTPLMAGAQPVEVADLPDTDLAETRDGDQFYLVPDTEAVFVRLRQGESPLLFAASCSSLTSVDLPDGWTGLCSERETDGEVQIGRFSYEDAVAR